MAVSERNSMQPGSSLEPVLRARGITRRYGNHLALKGVDLELMPGQVHVLFGENGAGKSTVISIMAGANQPTDGVLETATFRGHFQSVAQARREGIRAVFQEFSLVPALTVADNILLGEEPTGLFGHLKNRRQQQLASDMISSLGFALNANDRVGDLPRGKQQMVEICKAVMHPPKVLILDEPTASLSEHDTQALFGLIRRLQSEGTAIVYITHRMHEIQAIADCVTVLRDGHQIATVAASTPESDLIEMMTGRALADIYPVPTRVQGDVQLALNDLSTRDGTVRNANLTVRQGEIVGIAGLVGCGKSELGQACFGLKPLSSGHIELSGHAVNLAHPADAIKAGLWYSPSDRKQDGLALEQSAADNLFLSALTFGELNHPWRQPVKEKSLVARLSERVDFAHARAAEPVKNFSGGNQQKVMLAKSLAQPVTTYLFDEPTVGVDVGARKSIYGYLGDLSASGAAIVLISSDLPELLGMCHRILVMREGCLVAEVLRQDFDEHQILEHFFE